MGCRHSPRPHLLMLSLRTKRDPLQCPSFYRLSQLPILRPNEPVFALLSVPLRAECCSCVQRCSRWYQFLIHHAELWVGYGIWYMRPGSPGVCCQNRHPTIDLASLFVPLEKCFTYLVVVVTSLLIHHDGSMLLQLRDGQAVQIMRQSFGHLCLCSKM